MPAVASNLTLNGILQTVQGASILYSPPVVLSAEASNIAQSYELALDVTPTAVTFPANTQWFGLTPPIANQTVINFGWSSGDLNPVNPLYGIPAFGLSSNLTIYLSASQPVTVQIASA